MRPSVCGRSCAIVAVLIAAQALFVAAYVGSEHTIYFWDHAMYFNMARQAYGVISRGIFRPAGRHSGSRFANNYNLIFALPSFVSFSLFGPSRLVFILTNYCGFSRAMKSRLRFFCVTRWAANGPLALIVSLATAMLVPPLWLPLLEGYPDSGAATCLVLAAALSFDKTRFAGRFSMRLMTGIASWASPFFCAGILSIRRLRCLPDVWRSYLRGMFFSEKAPNGNCVQAAIYFALCGAGFIGVRLLSIAPEFVHDALTTDYGALYFSYKRPVWVFLRFLVGWFWLWAAC